MQTIDLNLNKRYSFADYLTWVDDKRRELFNGLIKLMSPAPLRRHQEIAGNIYVSLHLYLRKKKCGVYIAPFDVRFPKTNSTKDKEIFTVLQPDISIVCDPKKLDRKGCLGAPDMVIEVVSPGNSKTDVVDKFNIYQEHGVKEYWIVFPEVKTIHVFVLGESKKYELMGMFAETGKVKVNLLEDLFIDLEDIFTYSDEFDD